MQTRFKTSPYTLKSRNVCHFLIGLELNSQMQYEVGFKRVQGAIRMSNLFYSQQVGLTLQLRDPTYFVIQGVQFTLDFEKLQEIIYQAEKYETTLHHHDFFFSIHKISQKIHPFLICKSPYSLHLWYFYHMCFHGTRIHLD